MKKTNFKIIRAQDGLSLIEVLVTVIVMAVGLLGLAALQNVSTKLIYDSYLRTQSAILANDMFDRIRANPNELYALDIGQIPDQATCVSDGTDANFSCTPREVVEADLYHWHRNATAIFPDATLQISEDDGDYNVRFSWEDRYENDEADDEAQQFVYRFSVR